MLYRGMDRAALDAAYNNGAAVADAPRFRADWASRSAALRERHAATLDIVYGAAPRAKLDLFLAEPPGRATLIFIHGGYWQMNAKENFAFVAEGPLAHGINVASLGYTLAPDAGMDYDLEPMRRCYLNDKLGLDAATSQRNSPLFHLPESAGRLVVTVGAAELPELQRQSAAYFAAWTAHGLIADFVALPGCNHFSAIEELARPEGRLVAALRQLIADTGGGD